MHIDDKIELEEEGMSAGTREYLFNILPRVYKNDGILGVLGYDIGVTLARLFFGKPKIGEPIVWTDNHTDEERIAFARALKAAQPRVEAQLNGYIPLTCSDREAIRKYDERLSKRQEREKTFTGRIINYIW